MSHPLARPGETHLGNGVFVSHDGDVMTVRVAHINTSSTVHLTRTSFDALVNYGIDVCEWQPLEDEG